MKRFIVLFALVLSCERTETFRVLEDWDRAGRTEWMLQGVAKPAADYRITSYPPILLEDAVAEAERALASVTIKVCLLPTRTWLREVKATCKERYQGSWDYIPNALFSCYGPAHCDAYGCIEGDLVYRVEFQCRG